MSSQIKQIHLTNELPDEEVDKLGGTLLEEGSWDVLVNEDCDIFTPSGEPLIKFRKGVIPASMIKETYPIWKRAATPTDNRGMAAGLVTDLSDIRQGKAVGTDGGGKRAVIQKKDGTISNTTRAKSVNSGIVGFFDKSARFPYCRLTAFNLENMDQFEKCMPMIQLVDEIFKREMPDRHAAQMAVYSQSSKDFRIPGTSFTTITVNKNFRTAIHKDQGDLLEGFGVMTAIRAGKYSGGYTCFPKYRVAVDMQSQDLLLANVHQWHGNNAIKGVPGLYDRISLVFYFRAGIARCGSAEEELNKARQQTEAFYDKTLKASKE